MCRSAIGNAAQVLEDALGMWLFTRLPRGVELIPEGQDFLSHARHVLNSVSDALYMPLFRARGIVRVAASYTLLGYFLPELLARRGRG